MYVRYVARIKKTFLFRFTTKSVSVNTYTYVYTSSVFD